MTTHDRRITRRTALKAGAGVAAAAAFVSYPIRSSAQGKTTVRLSTFSSDVDLQIVQDQATAFMQQNPDIEVQVESVPSDYATKLTTDLASGNAADVFVVDSLLTPDLMTRNLLMPLDNNADLASQFGDFFPSLLAGYQYQGKTYGLPKDWSATEMFYSTTNFETAGISAAPANWDELSADLKALTDSTGMPGGIIAPDPASAFIFIYLAGGEVVTPDFSEIKIGDQATIDALTYYYGLYKDGIATAPADVGAVDQAAGLAQGSASVAFSGNWNYGGFKKNYPDFKFNVAPMPLGPANKPATTAFTVSYSMFAGTKVADAAYKLVGYLTGPDAMLKATTTSGVMPSRQSLTEQWLSTFPERKVFIDAGQYARPWNLGPGGQLFYGDATGIMQALFAGTVSVEDAAGQLKAAAQKDIQLQAGGATATPAS